MKVKAFDRKLNRLYGIVISWLSTVSSVILILIDIPEKYKNNVICILVFAIMLALTYIVIWIYSNKKTTAKLKIQDNNVIVKIGDIFSQDGLKVIPCNEYFDTEIGDRLISPNTLNGMYITKCVKNVKELDSKIKND